MGVWYFAYGSNLWPQRMHERTQWTPWGGEVWAACLMDHQLRFNKRSSSVPGRVFANILPALGHHVWGVVYRCEPEALVDLDHFEGVAQGNYRRYPVVVRTAKGMLLEAIAYQAQPEYVVGDRSPDPAYLTMILEGARHHGLPGRYIDRIVRQARSAAATSSLYSR